MNAPHLFVEAGIDSPMSRDVSIRAALYQKRIDYLKDNRPALSMLPLVRLLVRSCGYVEVRMKQSSIIALLLLQMTVKQYI